MIINVWKKQDLGLVKELPLRVIFTIEDTIQILDENYGTERTAEDLGGYIVVVDKAGIEELNQHPSTNLFFQLDLLILFYK